jgi:beta-galactosidase/beta-glucuronidase
MNALQDLEKLMRQKVKADLKTPEQMLSSLNGNWRLVFTTGTKDTQKKFRER